MVLHMVKRGSNLIQFKLAFIFSLTRFARLKNVLSICNMSESNVKMLSFLGYDGHPVNPCFNKSVGYQLRKIVTTIFACQVSLPLGGGIVQ